MKFRRPEFSVDCAVPQMRLVRSLLVRGLSDTNGVAPAVAALDITRLSADALARDEVKPASTISVLIFAVPATFIPFPLTLK